MKLATSFLLVLLFLLTFAAACSDFVDGPAWRFDEEDQLQELVGPPSGVHRYMGRVGEDHYFYLGARSDRSLIIEVYRPGAGWRIDSVLTDALTDEYAYFFGDGEMIIAHGDDHFIAHIANAELLHSDDDGQSWEVVGEFPEFRSLPVLRSDGEHLYVSGASPIAEEDIYFRSDDGGETWQPLNVSGILNVLLPGLLVSFVPVHEVDPSQVYYSLDRGDSWIDVPADCDLSHRSEMWFSYENQSYWLNSDQLHRFDPAGCESFDINASGPTGDSSSLEDIIGIHAFEDGVFVLTGSGELGRLEEGLSRWREIPTPSEEHLFEALDFYRYNLIDLGSQGLIFRTGRAYWQTDSDGQDWEVIGHERTTVERVTEFGGHIYAQHLLFPFFRHKNTHFRRSLYEGDWEYVEMSLDGRDDHDLAVDIVVRDNRVFGLGRLHHTVYVGDDDPTTMETLVEVADTTDHPGYGGFNNYSAPAVDIFAAGDRWFITSRGALNTPALPGSESITSLVTSENFFGGGIFVSDSIEEPHFEPFGTGLPTTEGEKPATIHAAQVFEDELFAVTGTRGVWRADLSTGQWTAAHDGLPTADNSEAGLQITQLTVVDDTLFALGADGAYYWTGQGWLRLTADSYSRPAGPEEMGLGSLGFNARAGIVQILSYDGLLLIAAFDGLYEVDRETGARRHVWNFDKRIVVTAEILPSGLYLGLNNGGLWRFEFN